MAETLKAEVGRLTTHVLDTATGKLSGTPTSLGSTTFDVRCASSIDVRSVMVMTLRRLVAGLLAGAGATLLATAWQSIAQSA